MIVLDTNVLSELMRAEPAQAVLHWVDSQAAEELFTSAITVAEILHGIERLPDGKRKANLHTQAIAMFKDDFADRILSFDAHAAVQYSMLVATRERSGKPVGLADAQIAAICRARRARLATRNTKDFDHTEVDIINPWTALNG
ncbi:VapC toxin protein [Pseudomonas synxantha]|uniref:type II toxin-antitoxin system VapC family toxin n=1 Tax=Pseudomonas synxantha TaxID=47883 RepID=UPI000F55D0BA|nr:type II toxin-antitoxin system VapC family toxin [Pseudomonas synxantha]AZE70542.1 VapC toxin protein [Pseudomonas synxantha]AZE76080.1 VapC toxin protein [Pseudomonas synxantha]